MCTYLLARRIQKTIVFCMEFHLFYRTLFLMIIFSIFVRVFCIYIIVYSFLYGIPLSRAGKISLYNFEY